MTTTKTGLRVAVLPLWLAILITTAHAQQAVPAVSVSLMPTTAVTGQSLVQAVLSAHKVQIKDGKEIFSDDARHARPGDVIEYRVAYRNASLQTIGDVQATLPLPEGTTYQSKSARPIKFTARIEGAREFSATPIKRNIVEAGRTKEINVPSSEYRELRWNLGELVAGQSKTVSARIVVPGGAKSGVNKAATQ